VVVIKLKINEKSYSRRLGSQWADISATNDSRLTQLKVLNA